VPEARRALADAGLTPREFVLIFGVSVGAKMANHMVDKEGTAPAAAAEASGITQAQLDFYRKNGTEIARLEKEAEAKAPSLKQSTEKAGAPRP
jgi:dipeptidyl aminopeptidase/acylaminoacyl peptidase